MDNIQHNTDKFFGTANKVPKYIKIIRKIVQTSYAKAFTNYYELYYFFLFFYLVPYTIFLIFKSDNFPIAITDIFFPPSREETICNRTS